MLAVDYGVEEDDLFCPEDEFFVDPEETAGTISNGAVTPTPAPTPSPTVSMESKVASWDLDGSNTISCFEFNKAQKTAKVSCALYELTFGADEVSFADMAAKLQQFV